MAQQSFEGMPVRDTEVKLAGNVYLDADDELTVRDQVAFVIVGRVDSVAHKDRFDKIDGLARIHVVQIEKSTRISDETAAGLFGSPVSLISDRQAQA